MRRTVGIVVGTLTAAATVLFAGFLLFAASATRYVREPVTQADGIVVLTGGDQRVAEAIRLLSDGRARRLLISGVNRHTTRADLRRQAGLAPLLFDCCVDVGYEAMDTVGNAGETRTWAGTWHFSRLIVVTSSYHMPRSLLEFSRAMPGAELVPHPVVSRNFVTREWWLHPGTARLLAHEYVKFLPSAARLAFSRITQRTGRDAKTADWRVRPAKS